MAREYLRLSEKGATLEELENLHLVLEKLIEGDLDGGSFMAGQILA